MGEALLMQTQALLVSDYQLLWKNFNWTINLTSPLFLTLNLSSSFPNKKKTRNSKVSGMINLFDRFILSLDSREQGFLRFLADSFRVKAGCGWIFTHFLQHLLVERTHRFACQTGTDNRVRQLVVASTRRYCSC